MLALMDSGSSFTLIHRSCLPPGCVPERLPMKQATQTAAGNFHFNQRVCLSDSHFPEFSRSLRIKGMAAMVFDAPCKYDMIVGRNWMVPNKFDIKFSTQTMTWFSRSVPMKPAATPEMFHINDDEFNIDDDRIRPSAIYLLVAKGKAPKTFHRRSTKASNRSTLWSPSKTI